MNENGYKTQAKVSIVNEAVIKFCFGLFLLTLTKQSLRQYLRQLKIKGLFIKKNEEKPVKPRSLQTPSQKLSHRPLCRL